MLIMAGCGKDDKTTAPTNNNAPFTFLKVGNEWEYSHYLNGEFMNKWTETIISENNGFFRYEMNINPEYVAYEFTSGEYWKTGIVPPKEDQTIDPSLIDRGWVLLYRNCYVGQKWDIDGFDEFFEVLSISETVTTEVGTFNNCIKVRSTEKVPTDLNLLYTQYHWIHKDVGIIKTEGWVHYPFISVYEPTLTILTGKNF